MGVVRVLVVVAIAWALVALVAAGCFVLVQNYGPLSLTAVGVSMIFASCAFVLTSGGTRWPWSAG